MASWGFLWRDRPISLFSSGMRRQMPGEGGFEILAIRVCPLEWTWLSSHLVWYGVQES